MSHLALFAFHDYEASGGWNDLVGRFDDLAKAKAAVDLADMFATSPATPAGWQDRRQALSTSLGPPPEVPLWASEPPTDAPPRPSGEHFWYAGAEERRFQVGQAHIVDLELNLVWRLGWMGWEQVDEES